MTQKNSACSIITDGLIDGWFIQDRPSEETSILCYSGDFGLGSEAIALRPRYMGLERWVSICRQIAIAMTPHKDPEAKAQHALIEIVGESEKISTTYVDDGTIISLKYGIGALSPSGPFNAVNYYEKKKEKT